MRCERVVYPAHCVEIACPRLYAHEDAGVTWIGCIDKVFSAEVDLARLIEQQAANPGFGALRAEDRKSTRLNSSHTDISRMPSSA